jgi:polyisoprenoid-binding protein YceI
MKKSTFVCHCLLTVLGFSLMLGVSARAQEMVRYRARPSSNTLVRINGSANIHEWEMEGNLIGGYLELPAGVTLDSSKADVAGAVDGKINAKVNVSIPVTSVVNAKYEGMSQAMQDAMEAATYPRIIYTLSELKLKQPHAAGTPLQFDATGDLAIHGVTNKISIPVTIENFGKNELKIHALNVPVKMTEYKVKPPVKGGIFVTYPDVKITFDWIVGMSAKAPEAK